MLSVQNSAMDTKFLQHLPQHSTRMPWQSCVMATVLATMTTNPKWKEIVDNLLPDAPCMRDDKIRFDYPKPFAEESSSADDAYPQYARPNNGRKCDKTGLDNRRVAAHKHLPLIRFQDARTH
ncbi:hypothetical protein WJX82_000034 [Trebouxia sp. C0006]